MTQEVEEAQEPAATKAEPAPEPEPKPAPEPLAVEQMPDLPTEPLTDVDFEIERAKGDADLVISPEQLDLF